MESGRWNWWTEENSDSLNKINGGNMKFFSLNYWIESYLIKYLKAFLDKSGSGWKTVLGLLTLVISELLKLCTGSFCVNYETALNILNQLPHDVIDNAGITLLVTGLVHKLINFIPKKN